MPISTLSIRIEGDPATIEWPGDCIGCVLEQSDLFGVGAVWTRSSAQPQLTNGRYRASVPISFTPRFYRLAVPLAE